MTLPMIWPDEAPRARRTDPIESHLAADMSDTAGSRRAVLLIPHAYRRAMTDHDIEVEHTRAGGHYTGQRLRTARHELVESGAVVRDGEKLGPSGYRTRSWRIA